MLVISLSCANRRTQALQSLPRQGFWFTSNHKLAHASNQVEDCTWATWKAKAALLGHPQKKFLIARQSFNLGDFFFHEKKKHKRGKGRVLGTLTMQHQKSFICTSASLVPWTDGSFPPGGLLVCSWHAPSGWVSPKGIQFTSSMAAPWQSPRQSKQEKLEDSLQKHASHPN